MSATPAWKEQFVALAQEAERYPLELRIAAQLYVLGATEETFAEFAKSDECRIGANALPDPMTNCIRIHLRDIEKKQMGYGNPLRLARLIEVAKKLTASR
jgi:hypothetical protein